MSQSGKGFNRCSWNGLLVIRMISMGGKCSLVCAEGVTGNKRVSMACEKCGLAFERHSNMGASSLWMFSLVVGKDTRRAELGWIVFPQTILDLLNRLYRSKAFVPFWCGTRELISFIPHKGQKLLYRTKVPLGLCWQEAIPGYIDFNSSLFFTCSISWFGSSLQLSRGPLLSCWRSRACWTISFGKGTNGGILTGGCNGLLLFLARPINWSSVGTTPMPPTDRPTPWIPSASCSSMCNSRRLFQKQTRQLHKMMDQSVPHHHFFFLFLVAGPSLLLVRVIFTFY